MHKSEKSVLRILFLYAGTNRFRLLNLCSRNEAPDTSFFGLSYLRNIKGVQTDLIERFSGWNVGFNLSFIPLFFKIWNYDIVFSAVGIPILLIRALIPASRPFWVIFNLNLTNLLKRSESHPLKYRLLLFIISRARHIICLSNSQRHFLLNIGLDWAKLSVVLFGVDKNFYKPVFSTGEEKYILSVGRDNGRDYRTLVAVAKMVDMKFVIVCSPRNIEGLGEIPENVEVRYDVDYQTLRSLYENARFVVVPSREEGYLDGSDCSGQTVILDAMSCGKAVIASRRSWMKDYFTDGEECFVIPPESLGDLKEKILFLLKTPEVLEIFGRKARARIDVELNSERMAERLYTVFKQI